MPNGTRFLIVSLESEHYAIPIARLLEITVARTIQKDPKLTGAFEGKMEFRGAWIPILNIKKFLKLASQSGTTLLVVKCGSGMLGLLVDAVEDIVDTAQRPIPLPGGIMDPSCKCYGGILRYKDKLALLLNEEGFLT
ncbi:MAG: chemotaxis protein CheW [Nitrospirota bacterium]